MQVKISSYLRAWMWFVLVSLFSSSVFADASQVFQGRFLIATEQLRGTGFEHAVIYVTKDSRMGTYGFIINRPTGIPMREILHKDDQNPHAGDDIFFGGPVHGQHIFLLAETEQQDNLHLIADQVYLAAGMDMLVKLTHDEVHPNVRAYVGFASWAPGQLEEEITEGTWVVAPAKVEQVFDQHPENLWKTLHERWSGRWL